MALRPSGRLASDEAETTARLLPFSGGDNSRNDVACCQLIADVARPTASTDKPGNVVHFACNVVKLQDERILLAIVEARCRCQILKYELMISHVCRDSERIDTRALPDQPRHTLRTSARAEKPERRLAPVAAGAGYCGGFCS